MHQKMAATLDRVLDEIAAIQDEARGGNGVTARPLLADDRAAARRKAGPGRRRSTACRSRAPGARIRCRSRTWPRTRSICGCSKTGCEATGPRSCSTRTARSVAELRALPPTATGAWARTRTPMAACCCAISTCPIFATTPSTVPQPGGVTAEATRAAGTLSARHPARQNAAQFPRLRPGRDGIEPAGRRCSRRPTAPGTAEILPDDDHLAPRRPGHGGAQRAHLPGLARRLSADRPARLLLVLRGVHPHRRFDVQPARQMAEGDAATSRGGGRSRR